MRAFIGHVEPTFNWTLRDARHRPSIHITSVHSLYNQLHLATRPPIGLAMTTYYANVGGLLKDHLQEVDAVNQHVAGRRIAGARGRADRARPAGTVILGDPTVALPRTA